MQALHPLSEGVPAKNEPPKNARISLPALAPELSSPAANAWEPSPAPRQSSVLTVAFDAAQEHLEVQLLQELSVNLLSILKVHPIAQATSAAHTRDITPQNTWSDTSPSNA